MKTITVLLSAILVITNVITAAAQHPPKPMLAKTIDSLVAVDQAPAQLKENKSAAWQQAIHSNSRSSKRYLKRMAFPASGKLARKVHIITGWLCSIATLT